jgi:hypothetical protein
LSPSRSNSASSTLPKPSVKFIWPTVHNVRTRCDLHPPSPPFLLLSKPMFLNSFDARSPHNHHHFSCSLAGYSSGSSLPSPAKNFTPHLRRLLCKWKGSEASGEFACTHSVFLLVPHLVQLHALPRQQYSTP